MLRHAQAFTLHVYTRLAVVVIEPGHGQSDVINKGMKRADGDVLGWRNWMTHCRLCLNAAVRR